MCGNTEYIFIISNKESNSIGIGEKSPPQAENFSTFPKYFKKWAPHGMGMGGAPHGGAPSQMGGIPIFWLDGGRPPCPPPHRGKP